MMYNEGKVKKLTLCYLHNLNLLICSNEAMPTSTTHIYNSTAGSWSEGPEYIYPVFGGTQLSVSSSGFFVVFGGVTSANGVQTDRSGLFFPVDEKWIEDDWAMGGPRSYGVGIHVENICPGSDDL